MNDPYLCNFSLPNYSTCYMPCKWYLGCINEVPCHCLTHVCEWVHCIYIGIGSNLSVTATCLERPLCPNTKGGLYRQVWLYYTLHQNKHCHKARCWPPASYTNLAIPPLVLTLFLRTMSEGRESSLEARKIFCDKNGLRMHESVSGVNQRAWVFFRSVQHISATEKVFPCTRVRVA